MNFFTNKNMTAINTLKLEQKQKQQNTLIINNKSNTERLIDSLCKTHYFPYQTLVNPCPAERCQIYPAFANTKDPDQLAFKKPTDLDVHCLPFSM